VNLKDIVKAVPTGQSLVKHEILTAHHVLVQQGEKLVAAEWPARLGIAFPENVEKLVFRQFKECFHGNQTATQFTVVFPRMVCQTKQFDVFGAASGE
jgi:hypothetical protein